MSDQKQLIECITGGATTSIGSTTYDFERDRYGRFVASVPNIRHRSCLLSVEHYRAVPDHPAANGTAPMGQGVVQRSDGPTVEQYVAAGYLAVNYPPHGYASRSTQEEIDAAIAAQAAASASDDNDPSGQQDNGQQSDPGDGADGRDKDLCASGTDDSGGSENRDMSAEDSGNGHAANMAIEGANGDTADGEEVPAPNQSGRRRK